ncbi:MAG: hypothetical protein U5K84_14470 [Alkalibacterium sp.]|nr:hypothetical protein [Alkalibacterium sp.]
MSVTIYRESAFFRGFSRLHIKLNGEKVDTITSGEKKQIDVPSEGALLKVTQLAGKSNTLKVSKGDQVQLSVAPWSSWLMILFLIFSPIVITYSSILHPVVPLLLIWAVLFLVFTYFETYRLVKVATGKKVDGDN